jgi:hypothetical protein
MKSRRPLILLSSFLLLTLGTIEGCAPVTPIPATQKSLEVVETLTASPVPQPYATRTQPSPPFLKPSVTGSRLIFESWSPDSQWVAYWYGDQEYVTQDNPAHLAFLDVRSGRVCKHQELNIISLSGHVTWLKDERFIAVEGPGGNVFEGVPCEELSPVENYEAPQEDTGQISLDGRYRAEMKTTYSEGERQENVTTIKEIATDQIVFSVEWIGGAPYARADRGWLTNELYIIGLDVTQGVIYFSTSTMATGNVVSDLLGLNPQEVKGIHDVSHHVDAASGEYHLLIEFWSQPPSTPAPLLLYHSETDSVETIPFYTTWGINGSPFSQDGRWLFLSYPTSETYDYGAYWIRAVDPVGSTPRLLENEYQLGGLSTAAQKIIFAGGFDVKVLDFPSGEFVAFFDLSGYELNRIKWSPDGTRIMVQGSPFDSRPEAIFILEP